MAFILILCHCIVVLFELCIDNNQIQFFFFFFFACHPGHGMPVRETYIQICMALLEEEITFMQIYENSPLDISFVKFDLSQDSIILFNSCLQ